MATISICSSSVSRLNSLPSFSSSPSISSSSLLSYARSQRRNNVSLKKLGRLPLRIRAIEEEEATTTITPEEEEEEAEVKQEEQSSVSEQSVSVPVSPSDILTMFFQAEGVMDESAVSKVTNALQVVEGVSDLNVGVLEGIASVELKKQTTVQATGVASNLVEIIQGSGFKLQTLNLSFEDEEDAI